jgi:hypothetical protein
MKSKLLDEDLTEVGPHWKQIVLQALTIEDMLGYFPPADLLAQFKSKGFLAQYKPADLLAHVKPKDIENYLTRLKQSPRATTAKAKPKTRKPG